MLKKKKKVRMVELQQFECYFLNIEVKSTNRWIVQGVKCIFPKIY
jgi:hypothetical protein